LLNRYIDSCSGLRSDLNHLQQIETVDEQAFFYRQRIAPVLWSTFTRWILRRRAAMTLLGVPDSQVDHMNQTNDFDLASIIEQRIDRVFTQVPLRHNYFWRVYLNGAYSRDCCPNYLKEEHFKSLRELAPRIKTHTSTLTAFLEENHGPFSVFVLLDHMDWLTDSPQMLAAEWNSILGTARPEARIIFRSGGSSFEYLPGFAKRHLVFEAELTKTLNERDRVGTYGSFYLARLIPA
jgi:S-adenosylmethionine-diacylglycerol 3-amino-3-carboxypropyl transferase